MKQCPTDNNSPNAQRASILHWFRKISYRLSTLDARERLGIMSPASRIYDMFHVEHCLFLFLQAR